VEIKRLIRSWGAGHREYDNPELAGLCDVATAEFLEEVSGQPHWFWVRDHPLYPTEGLEEWGHEIAQVGVYFVDWTPRQFDPLAARLVRGAVHTRTHLLYSRTTRFRH